MGFWRKRQVGLLPHVNFGRKRLPIAAMVAVLWAAPVASQQTEFGVAQVQQIAIAALRDGNPVIAAEAANALIRRNSSDAGALLLRTEAALLAGDYEGAVRFGSRAYWHAENGNRRFSAARLVALAHAEQSNDSRSQIWLRLARQDAPNDEASEAVARDFRFLRARNPLSVNLRFGITPSTNVNNGSSSETTDLFDLGLPFVLSPDARSLSGWEVSGNVDLRYRLHTNDTSATFLDFGLSGRTYWLTENARDQVAGLDIDGGDFSNATLSFGVTHRFVLTPDSRPTSVSLSFGQSWYGGDENARFYTAQASHSWKLSDVDTLSLSGFAQQQDSLTGGETIKTYSTQTAWTRDLGDYGDLTLSLASRASQSANSDQAFDSTRYGIGYAFPEPIFGVQFGVNYSYEERAFAEHSLAPVNARDDRIDSVTVRAVFTDVEFFGFQPVVTFEKTVQDSTIDLFDRDFSNFGFDITSSF